MFRCKLSVQLGYFFEALVNAEVLFSLSIAREIYTTRCCKLSLLATQSEPVKIPEIMDIARYIINWIIKEIWVEETRRCKL